MLRLSKNINHITRIQAIKLKALGTVSYTNSEHNVCSSEGRTLLTNAMKYRFSMQGKKQQSLSFVKDHKSLVTNNSESTRIEQLKEQQQQQVITVDFSKPTMLFMNSAQLSAIIRLTKIRNTMRNSQDAGSQQPERTTFSQLNDRIRAITHPNEYLSKGNFEQYKDYPIVKLTQICLRIISCHPTVPHSQLYPSPQSPRQHWKQLQYYIRKRMHNCSSKDYVKIVYIVLNAYKSVYKFSSQFIEGLLKGLKKEIRLMEEGELMGLFVVVSHRGNRERLGWEMGVRYSGEIGGSFPTTAPLRSPFFQHQLLTTLHDQLLQKIVRRYQNKYLNNPQLTLKEQQLFKLCWWLQKTIVYRNQTLFHLKDSDKKAHSSLVVNRYIVGMVNVLGSRLLAQGKKQQQQSSSSSIKGQLIARSRQIENRSVRFRSGEEMLQFLEILALARDHLKEEGERQITTQGLDQNSKQLRQKALIWLQKSSEVNQVMKTVLSYGGVQQHIQQLFHKTDTGNDNQQEMMKEQQKEQEKRDKEQLVKYERRWRLLEVINGCYEFSSNSNSSNSNTMNSDVPNTLHQWHTTLLHQYSIIPLFHQTTTLIRTNLTHPSQQSSPSLSPPSLPSPTRLHSLLQSQLTIFYQLYNNNPTNSQLNATGLLEGEEVREQLREVYVRMMEVWCEVLGKGVGRMRERVRQQESSGVKQQGSSQQHSQQQSMIQTIPLTTTIHPSTITKLINIELTLNLTLSNNLNITLGNYHNHPNHNHPNQHPAIHLITAYAEQLLGVNHSRSSSQGSTAKQERFSFYVRELQFGLFNYFSVFLDRSRKGGASNNNNSDNDESQQSDLNNHHQDNQLTHLTTLLLTRNHHAQHYLQTHSQQYLSLLTNEKPNPFLQKPPHPTSTFSHNNNYRSLTSHHLSLQNYKQQLLSSSALQTDHGFDRQAVLLGQHIVKCIKDQRKRLSMNEDIVRLNKFFTEIKAFKEIRFCCPVGVFMQCPMFVARVEGEGEKCDEGQNRRGNNSSKSDRRGNNSSSSNNGFISQITTTSNNNSNTKQDITNLSLNTNNNTQHNPNNTTPTTKALLFLPTPALSQPSLLSLTHQYSLHSIQTIPIDITKFLNMHINERIELLNRVIFASGRRNNQDRVREVVNGVIGENKVV